MRKSILDCAKKDFKRWERVYWTVRKGILCEGPILSLQTDHLSALPASWHLSPSFNLAHLLPSIPSCNTFKYKTRTLTWITYIVKAPSSLRGLKWKSLAKLDLNFVRRTNSPPNGFRFCSRIYFKYVYDLSYCIWVAKHIFPFPRFQEIWATRDIHPTLGFTINLVLINERKEFFSLNSSSTQFGFPKFYRLQLWWLIVKLFARTHQ